MREATHPKMGRPAPDRPCQFCRTEIPARAAKCAACGEWTEGAADYSPLATGLRLVAFIWIVLSVAAGLLGVLLASDGSGTWGMVMSVAILLQGLLVGLSALVLADLASRRLAGR